MNYFKQKHCRCSMSQLQDSLVGLGFKHTRIRDRCFTHIKSLLNLSNHQESPKISIQSFLCHKFTYEIFILSENCSSRYPLTNFVIFFQLKFFIFWPLTSWKLQLQVTFQSWLRMPYKHLLFYVYTSSKSNKKYRKNYSVSLSFLIASRRFDDSLETDVCFASVTPKKRTRPKLARGSLLGCSAKCEEHVDGYQTQTW